MRDHMGHRAFELADEVAVSVYQVDAGFPREKLSTLTSQMRWQQFSILSNLVEGLARDRPGKPVFSTFSLLPDHLSSYEYLPKEDIPPFSWPK